MKVRSLIVVGGGLASVVAAVLAYGGAFSNHYDDPIIIDNGPAVLNLLPYFGHEKNLVYDGTAKWKVTEKLQHIKIVIKWTAKGKTVEQKDYLDSSTVTIWFDTRDESGRVPAGTLYVDWVSGSPYGVQTLTSNDKVGWRKDHAGFFNYYGLKSVDDADYRIRQVDYKAKGGDGSWPPKDTDLKDVSDVDVILCPSQSKDSRCEWVP